MNQSARFGPNAGDVTVLLEELEHLGMAEVLGLAAARWGMTVEPGSGGTAWVDLDERRAAARARLRQLAEQYGRLAALRAVGDDVAAWTTSLAHWFPAGVIGLSPAAEELPPRMAATPAILDAAYATVMEDLLTEEETDLLCAAWDEIVPDQAGPRGEPEPGSDEATVADQAGPEDERQAGEVR